MLKGQSRYQVPQDVVFTKLKEGEGVLLHLGSKLYYSLNGSGSFLWQLMESKEAQTIDELSARLEAHYQIPPQQAHSDCDELLRELLGEGLIEKVS